MSDLSKKARASAEQKAERLTRSGTGKIDASGWQEPLGEMGQVQTGPRPIARRQFRAGGKVTGSRAIMHAGRKPRATGASTIVDGALINRNIKEANESRPGAKHIGGMKKGGRAHKFVGGPMMGRPGMPASAPMEAAGRRPAPVMSRPGMRPYAKGGKCAGGSAYAKGGGIDIGTRPAGDRIARASGGRSKKGMNVNIVIAPQGGGGVRPPMPMGATPGPVGIPAPPPQMPPPGAGAPMAPPIMARKHGGRTNYPIDTGSGGGARLEKIKAYGART